MTQTPTQLIRDSTRGLRRRSCAIVPKIRRHGANATGPMSTALIKISVICPEPN
jgi:hypothetical protein